MGHIAQHWPPCHLQVLHSPGEVVGTCSLDWRKALISQGQPAVLTGELLLGSQSGQRGLDMVGVLSLEVEVGSLSQIVSPSDGKLDRRVFSLSPLPSTSACGPVGAKRRVGRAQSCCWGVKIGQQGLETVIVVTLGLTGVS